MRRRQDWCVHSGRILDNTFRTDVYTYCMAESLKQNRLTLSALPCACANLRRAARSVTRLYNRELHSDGIEITRFTSMMALKHVGEISQGALVEIRALDSSSLTRMLKLRNDHGWVQAKADDDRRFRLC